MKESDLEKMAKQVETIYALATGLLCAFFIVAAVVVCAIIFGQIFG